MSVYDEYKPIYKLTKQVLSLINEGMLYRATINKCESKIESSGTYDIVSLDFEVVGLCQFPLYDIRSIEPIMIIISDGAMPKVILLRNDFPAVPHLNIHKDDTTKSMCYSELCYEEISHKMNARFLLECVNNWFVKTGRNELHRSDQPLEPFFLCAKDVIILNPLFIDQSFGFFRNSLINNQNILMQTDNNVRNDESDCYAICRMKVEAETRNIIHRPPQTFAELTELFLEQNIMDVFKTFINQTLLIRRNAKEFQRLFNQSLQSLLNCKIIIMIDIPLVRDKKSTTEVNDYRIFVIDSALNQILANFGYKKEQKNKKKSPSIVYHKELDNNGENIRLKMFNPQLDFTSRYAQIMNDNSGLKGNNYRITQIGSGALGAQIFENCLRAGFGKWSLIDDDQIWPHNLSRHTLTRKDIGKFKTKALVERASSIIIDDECVSIHENIFSNSKNVLDALSNADLIIDTSATIAVERYLAIDSATTARKVSFFLNPTGTATIMLLESKDKTIRLDLLEMQYYYSLLLDPAYESHLLLPESVSYAGTCRSVTSRLSQDNIALSAALSSKALKKYTSDKEAKIIIWVHKDENVNADIINADEWIQFSCDNEWMVYIRQQLMNEIRNQRNANLPNETGGVLVGNYDYNRKILYIADQIKSPDDSIASPKSFIRGCLHLEENLNYIKEITKDNLYYTGEWHSHSGSNTQPSVDDINLFNAIIEYNRGWCRPACMLILGTDITTFLIDE